MSQEDLDNFAADMERRLESLSPRPVQAGRDRLMYEAGRRKERRTLRLWQSMAGTLAAVVAVSIFIRPEPRPIEQIAAKEPPAAATAAVIARHEPSTAQSWDDLPRPAYLRIRQAVLDHGIDALPDDETTGSRIRRVPTLLESRQTIERSLRINGGRL